MNTLTTYLVLVTMVTTSSAFNLPGRESSICSPDERCVPFLECKGAVRDFREKGVRPDICSFSGRMPDVCCAGRLPTRPVKKEPEVVAVLPGRCGVGRKRGVTRFQLQERKGQELDLLLQELLGEVGGRRRRRRRRQEKPIRLLAQTFNQPLVVGGTDVLENSYPWMAALGSRSDSDSESITWFCGASLIASQWVLTAAHCLQEGNPSSPFPLDLVRLGAHDMSNPEEDVEDYSPQMVFIHPGYKHQDPLPGNDIALVKLQTGGSGVTLRPEVGPVCLPSPGSELTPGSRVLVTGWGATQEGGLVADTLQEVEVKVTEQERCSRVYREILGLGEDIGRHTLCAGLHEGGSDACQGDSGGPLVQQTPEGLYQLVGVVSAGIGCARRDVPGLYTRVSYHREWLEGVIREHSLS